MKATEYNRKNFTKSNTSVSTKTRTKDEKRHAFTLCIYTLTTVKTVKLSVQKSTLY